MTKKEKILKEIKDYRKRNRTGKIFGFVMFSLIFGGLIMLIQMLSITTVFNRPDDFVYQEHGKNSVQVWTNSTSEKMNTWIYSKYSKLENDVTIYFFLIGSSLLISMFMSYLVLPTFGSRDRMYFDEIVVTASVNGNPVKVNSSETNNLIQSMIAYNIRDYDDNNYKIDAGTYKYTGIRGTSEMIVEKWKVSDKFNKWWF